MKTIYMKDCTSPRFNRGEINPTSERQRQKAAAREWRKLKAMEEECKAELAELFDPSHPEHEEFMRDFREMLESHPIPRFSSFIDRPQQIKEGPSDSP